MEVDPTIPPEKFRLWDGRVFRTNEMLRFKPGTDLASVMFKTGYAEAARSSYAVFQKLRSNGRIPRGVRFQVCLPTPMAPGYMDISYSSRADFLAAYERSLLSAVQEIVQAIPSEELSIQWDTCQEILVFEGYFEDRPANYKEAVVSELTRLGNAIPANVDFGSHLCYGSPTDEHLVTPKDMGVLCEITKGIADGLKRPLNFIHMPVPQLRTDDLCFAPLRGLSLNAGTDHYLGLLAEDDTDGNIARITAASRVLPVFGVATECGWGRKNSARAPRPVAMHKVMMRPPEG